MMFKFLIIFLLIAFTNLNAVIVYLPVLGVPAFDYFFSIFFDLFIVISVLVGAGTFFKGKF